MSLSIYRLKPRFQLLLRPLLDGLARLRITPNQVTLFAMALSVAYGCALAVYPSAMGLWLALPAFMLLRMALNAIDGMLASATGQTSRLGVLLNEMCDQVSDAALYLPFALVAGIYAPLLVAVVVLALLAEFAGVLAVAVGIARRFDGPMGKSDRAFAFSVLAIAVWWGAPQSFMNGLLSGVVLLLLSTIFNRLRHALRVSAPPTH